ncbi:MAG: hypothetical protein N2109_02015 [Fimbriimonadales bacterium]|nr:hypothetical protein [Fimbriimonadales bacterium]
MRTLRNLLLIVGLALSLAACGGPQDESAPVTSKEEPAPLSDPAKQALLPKMSEVARNATGGWASLSPDQRAPFLEFHAGNEERARTHYETLVETEKEIRQNLGQ